MLHVFRRKKDKSEPEDKVPNELEYTKNILIRDSQYAELLMHHVAHQKRLDFAQLLFKYFFFFLVCFVFISVVVLGALSIFFIAKKESIAWTDFGTALTGLGSVLGVLMILPSKIAEHLFPSSADKTSMEFIRSMQDYDLSISHSDDRRTDLHIEKPEDPAQSPDILTQETEKS